MKLGEAIKKRRKRQKMKQKQLADATGMSRPAITQIESGVRGTSIEGLIKIATALGTKAWRILKDVEEK